MILTPDFPRYINDCKRAGLNLKALNAAIGYHSTDSMRALRRGEISNPKYTHGRTLELIWQATHEARLYVTPQWETPKRRMDTFEPVPELLLLLRTGFSESAVARHIESSTTRVSAMRQYERATALYAERIRDMWRRCQFAGLPELMQRTNQGRSYAPSREERPDAQSHRPGVREAGLHGPRPV